MFGRSIEDTVKVDSRRGGGTVPIIIEKCVEYVRNYGKLAAFSFLQRHFFHKMPTACSLPL